MNFAQPLAAWWLALAVPIVVFYILKVRLRRVPVSTLMFWRKIYDEKQPRSLWQKLRHILSLLLQLLFLALLTFSLVDPHFAWESLQSRRIVIVLDNSGGMRATDIAPSRFDEAVRLASGVLESARFHDEIAVVSVSPQPRVVCGLTSHVRTLQEALRSVRPVDGPSPLADAVSLARRLIGGVERSRVYVVSDGAFPGADALSKEPDVEWVGLGVRAANVGITRFQVRRSLLDPIAYQTLLEVTNAADAAAECRLTLTLAGELVDVVPLKMRPGESVSRVFDNVSAAGGELVATLEHTDALVTDNRAVALLPERKPTRVVLCTKPNLFLEKVIEANPLVALEVTRDVAAGKSGDVTVFHRDVPKVLPPGPVFVIDPRTSCELWEVGKAIPSPLVAKQDKGSLYLTHVRLDNVQLPEARELSFKGEITPLVTAVTGQVLYGSIRRDSGPVLVLPVNLDEGDLPFRTAFPILFTNALSQLTGGKDELRTALATGEVTTVTATELGTRPAGVPSLAGPVLLSPGGVRKEFPAEATSWSLGPFDEAGVWKFGWEETVDGVAKPPTGVALAVNLASRSESDLRVPESLLNRAGAGGASLGWGWRSPWYYAALVAWLVIVVEWLLYQRRWIT
jgi:hypothetical protein